ncbi:hypothetical protein [Moorena sp. SIO4G3]|uniref:hypothetical protein n=1 Tax=Moorena sp. SIO4G3 TaxID=2607821 RepID=UPI00142B7320|nr:hypothetical protein [Moorena sp. SIO4G3]NEO81642.1 hypothetical protein [Moorena sp. SIO4G3]
MSRIIYKTTASGPKWSTQSIIFTSTKIAMGALSVRQGQSFGASSASAVLGPDINMPGGETKNPPTAVGYPWDESPPKFAGGPAGVTFDEDETYDWVRGHLINGRWGGGGNTWQNLTPLTKIANPNHGNIESYMDRYLINSLNYENSGYRNCWYGIYYAVQCSTSPFAAVPANNNLYSYAPEFIKITWRAVSVVKPVDVSVATARANPLSAGNPTAVPVLPFQAPMPPKITGWPVATLPVGNVAGGHVLGALPVGFPAQQNNGFDGEIEIHQS